MVASNEVEMGRICANCKHRYGIHRRGDDRCPLDPSPLGPGLFSKEELSVFREQPKFFGALGAFEGLQDTEELQTPSVGPPFTDASASPPRDPDPMAKGLREGEEFGPKPKGYVEISEDGPFRPRYYKPARTHEKIAADTDVWDICYAWDVEGVQLGMAMKYILRAGRKPGEEYAKCVTKAIECLRRALEDEERLQKELGGPGLFGGQDDATVEADPPPGSYVEVSSMDG